jgi:hypothetical protein
MEPRDLTIIVNTGDDITMHGLKISPDLDIVTYTLAGIIDPAKGWGFRHETFHALKHLASFGRPNWFNLGDRDLATHIHRTAMLAEGKSLTDSAESIRAAFGVKSRILPMSNEPVPTVIRSTWDYIHDLPRFLDWADEVERAATLWNPARIVRWNAHKGYLAELARAGHPVTPTVFVERGSHERLATIAHENSEPAEIAFVWNTSSGTSSAGTSGLAYERAKKAVWSARGRPATVLRMRVEGELLAGGGVRWSQARVRWTCVVLAR